MEIVYTGEIAPYKFKKSLFLAGPSARPGQDIESWRKDAIKILQDKGFDGVIFCPENRDFKFKDKDFNYDDQVEWEDKYLSLCDCILFWVPRDLSIDKDGNMKLPAFTTNIEFGKYETSGKIVLGYPEDAEKMAYLKHDAETYNIPVGDTLTETIDFALEFLGEGSERENGECCVPLFIWNTPSFQSWYCSQLDAGNRLESAKLLYNFRPRYKSFVFLWILKVNIYIASEDRFKENEFVLARTDISSVMLWHKKENILDSEVVLIKEFRSPAATDTGFITELPSGSSFKEGEDPLEVASQEVKEETDFYIDPKRLKFICAKQLAGTLSSHKSHLYSAELDEEELKWFKSQKDVVHGNIEDSERTFIEIFKIKDLLENKVDLDWSTLGQILFVLNCQN